MTLIVLIRLTYQKHFCRRLSSLFTLHLNLFFFRKFSSPFPSLQKDATQSTIASSVGGVGGTLEAIADRRRQTDQMIALVCEVNVSGVIRQM